MSLQLIVYLQVFAENEMNEMYEIIVTAFLSIPLCIRLFLYVLFDVVTWIIVKLKYISGIY